MSLDSRPLMSPTRPTTPASQRELDRELGESGAHRAPRRPRTKAFLLSSLASFAFGFVSLALLLLFLPPPPPSPSSIPVPKSFFSPSRLLEVLCEVPQKRMLEARSGAGYFDALDAAAAALPPALHATLALGANSGAAFASGNGGRLIFVGDVHGCADELTDLLRKIDFQKRQDTLVLLGDLVSKGPDSPRVLSLARELGALAVRGNHDDAALAAYDFSRKHNGALPKLSANGAGGEDFAFVRNLTKADARLLREMPWTLEVPALRAVAVHAGLVPGVPVNRQRPSDVFTMRGVVKVGENGDDDGDDGERTFFVRSWRWLLRTLFHGSGRRDRGSKSRVSYRATAAVGEGEPWARAWSSLPGQNRHALFGHDARAGLQLEAWATGLDTGCVAGGELTALVLSSSSAVAAANGDDKEEEEEESKTLASTNEIKGRWPERGVELVSVKCRGVQGGEEGGKSRDSQQALL